MAEPKPEELPKTDGLYVEVRKHPYREGIVWRAQVTDTTTGKILRQCSHRHHLSSAAGRCGVRMAGQVNRERGTRKSRGRIPAEQASAGQLRTRIAFAAGKRAAAVARLLVNWLIKEHEAHDFEKIEPSKLGDGESFGIECHDCDVTVRVKTQLEYAEHAV